MNAQERKTHEEALDAAVRAADDLSASTRGRATFRDQIEVAVNSYRAALAAREEPRYDSKSKSTWRLRVCEICGRDAANLVLTPSCEHRMVEVVVAPAAARKDTERPDDERYRHALRDAGRSINLCRPIQETMRIIDDALQDTERLERYCPHCGKLMLVPGRNYEIDPAAVCRCGGRAEPPKNQLQAIVDFLDSWRYCPVSSSDNASRQCLEKAARELLTHLADSEATEVCPWCSGANRAVCVHCNGTGRRARASHRCGSCGLEHSFEGDLEAAILGAEIGDSAAERIWKAARKFAARDTERPEWAWQSLDVAVEDLDSVLKWVREVGMNGPATGRPLSVSGDVGMAVMRLESALVRDTEQEPER